MRTKGGASNKQYHKSFFNSQKESKKNDNKRNEQEQNRSNFSLRQFKKLTPPIVNNPSADELALNVTGLFTICRRFSG